MYAMNLRMNGLPRMQLYSMLKLATSNVSISLCMLSPDPQDTSRSMHPMRVDDWPGITTWKVSCTRVSSTELRTISLNVFLMMRLSEAPLLIRVLATLCRLIRSLTTKGKFQRDNSVVGWSSGPNEMSVSDYFILLSGSMR
jgi:hypothetical protein